MGGRLSTATTDDREEGRRGYNEETDTNHVENDDNMTEGYGTERKEAAAFHDEKELKQPIEPYDGRDRMTTLEIELLYHVATFLSPKATICLGLTNKHFRDMLLNHDDVWKQHCKQSIGFSLTSDKTNEVCVNKLLFKSWKSHNPRKSLDLAKARGYESSAIGYAGSPSPAYGQYRLFKSNFRKAEQLYWYCMYDPSPVVRAYSIEGCLKLLRAKKTDFPMESFQEMLFHLALYILPYTEVVSTLSGCCGGSQSVSYLVREAIMHHLNQEQRDSVEDKIIELGEAQYEIRSIIMRRAQQNQKDKKLHDQVKQLCLSDEWFAILTLADYQDEEDVDYFIDVMKELMTWQPVNGAPRKSQFRQLYSALVKFPHKHFWPFLVELHKVAISSQERTPVAYPDSMQANLYMVIAKYRRNEAIDIISEAVDKLEFDYYGKKAFWDACMKALGEWLNDTKASEKSRVEELVWKVAGKYKVFGIEAMRYMLENRTEETIERLANGSVPLKCSDYTEGVSREVVSAIMDKLLQLNHPRRCDILLMFVKEADCHNCEFLCSYIPKVGGTRAQFASTLKTLSQDWNGYISTPAKEILSSLK